MSDAAPLAGLTVLDLGHTIMGPCAGLILADLGGDVIKIEPPEGDPTRRLPGFGAGFFATFNRNKRSLSLDLKRPEGRAALHRLAARADILLENFGPGTMERLGCGWEVLTALNPRLIYLALKGYLAGPSEGRGALDEVVQMQTGLATMTGPPGRPLRAGASVIDIMGAVFGVVGALAALRERDRTGRGQRVGSALFESAAFLVGTHIAGSALTGGPIPPMPARRSPWGIYDLFESADDALIFVGVTSDAHWRRFAPAFDLVDLLDDNRLTGNAARAAERAWLIPRLAERMRALPAADIVARCEAAGVPHARVAHPFDLLQEPHLLAGGGLLPTALATAGGGGGERAGLPALPLEFGEERTRAGLHRQPPAVGEQSDEILRQAGFSAAETSALRAAGALG